MRIVLIDPFLAAGGAQKVMCLLANEWAARNREVTLLTYAARGTSTFFELDGRVRHVPLNLGQFSTSLAAGVRNNSARLLKLRSAIKEAAPDVIISFCQQNNVLTLLAVKGLNVPVMVSDRIDPASDEPNGVWDRGRLKVYGLASRIVVQTKRAGDFFPPHLQSRIVVIPNAVPPPNGNVAAQVSLRKPALVAVGRLARQKGFDLLLRAFAKVHEKHPEWNLNILGEGPARKELEALVNQSGLAGRVSFHGWVSSTNAYLRAADLYVASSRFEGFPNALCEAMACGLPVIAMDCQSGPREIIRDGVDGLLVRNGDVDALAAAMARLMANQAEREQLARHAPEVVERFSIETVMGLWDGLLHQVLEGRTTLN